MKDAPGVAERTDGWPDDWQVHRHSTKGHVTVIQSGYGPHDEALELNGNFGDQETREAYALEIAKVLNEHFSKWRPTNPRILEIK